MTHIRLVLKTCVAVCVAVACSLNIRARATDLQAVERTPDKPACAAPVTPVPPGARLVCVPVLAPGKQALVSVLDKGGMPLSGVSVLVNGQPFNTDAYGRAVVSVPNTGAVALTLPLTDKGEAAHKEFALVPAGMLVAADAAPLVQALMATAPATSSGPLLLYAPAVVESGEIVPILGKNFVANGDGERLIIDGMQAELLSSSPLALLAKTPTHLGLGPIKELYVATKGSEPSNIVETDVAKTELGYAKDELTVGADFPARIGAYGTNLPVLVEATNNNSGSLTVTLPDGKPMGETAVMVLPGGESNYLPVTLRQSEKDGGFVSVRLLPDAPELMGQLPKDQSQWTPLLQAVNRAKLIKLKRRLVGVEDHLLDARKRRDTPQPGVSPDDIEKLNAELRALAVRQQALSTMLCARKAVFQAVGGTEDQYKQAMDDATGGAYYALEKSARDVLVVAASPLVSQARGAQAAFVPPPPIRFRLPEPKIKLLPPLDEVIAVGPNAAGSQVPVPGTHIQIPDAKQQLHEPSVSPAASNPRASEGTTKDTSANTAGAKTAVVNGAANAGADRQMNAHASPIKNAQEKAPTSDKRKADTATPHGPQSVSRKTKQAAAPVSMQAKRKKRDQKKKEQHTPRSTSGRKHHRRHR